MATSPEFHPRSFIFPRALTLDWWLAAPLAIVVLIAYCELHSLVTGRPSAGLGVSAPWAFRVAFGWIAAGAMVAIAGPRVARSPRIAPHPRIAAAVTVFGITLFTLICEWVMTGGHRWESVPAFLYDRAPLHGALAALLLAVFIPRTKQSPALGQTPDQAETAPAEKTPAVRATSQQRIVHTMEVMTGTGKTRIRIDEIEQIEADGNYLCVRHNSGRSYLLRQTLTCAERSLPAGQFVRVHRSTIVNRDMIRERRSGGVLVLRSGQTVRIGRAYRDQAPDPRIHRRRK